MKYTKYSYPLLIVLTLLVLGSRYMYDDLREDEAMSLINFALQDLHKTVTYYPGPNNHIFFNLFNNVFSRVIGATEIHQALDYIHYFRCAQFLVAFGTLFYLFLFAKRFFNQNTAWISTIILISTIPFLNYMMQLRGYNFSTFFGITTVYYTFLYLEEQKRQQLFLSAISSFLLLYTIPSNLYYYLSLMMLVGLAWIHNFYKHQDLTIKAKFWDKTVNRSHSLMLLSAAIVVCFIIICYIPAYHALLNSKTITRQPSHRFFVLITRLPEVLNFFISGRAILIGLALAGIIINKSWKNNNPLLQRWGQLLILLIMPFVFSFLRNDLPLQRTFVMLTPIFSLLLAVPLHAFIASINLQNKHIGLLSLYVFCISTCLIQLDHIQVKLDENLKNGIRERGLYYNFYQSDSYQYLNAAKFISKHYQKKKLPVLVIPRTLDAIAFVEYLNKYGIKNYLLDRDHKYRSTANNLEVKVLISAPDLSKDNTYKPTVKHKIKKQQIPTVINQTIALIDFIQKKEKVKDFYVVHSFHKTFKREVAPYFTPNFKIEKLSKGEGSLNFYRFKKKKKFTKKAMLVN